MAKGSSGFREGTETVMPKDAPPNGDATPEDPAGPRRRVSEMQAKLHRWAAADPGRRFDDLFSFVHDPATLIVAFDRVAGNRGARYPSVDGMTVTDVEELIGIPGFLNDLRDSLKDRSFRPLPVRERKIPKPGGSGKVLRLGIPTVMAGGAGYIHSPIGGQGMNKRDNQASGDHVESQSTTSASTNTAGRHPPLPRLHRDDARNRPSSLGVVTPVGLRAH
ncbi:hypothetical protein ACFXGL_33585 [Nocardia tengchongensis]|uniref:hypothetical protein n=1 Tax=Nocardia tengchongensis TaxID=2055889 RepID=UPI00367E9AF1